MLWFSKSLFEIVSQRNIKGLIWNPQTLHSVFAFSRASNSMWFIFQPPQRVSGLSFDTPRDVTNPRESPDDRSLRSVPFALHEEDEEISQVQYVVGSKVFSHSGDAGCFNPQLRPALIKFSGTWGKAITFWQTMRCILTYAIQTVLTLHNRA